MHEKFKEDLTVIVLCGGKGKRLYPLTKNFPKPLIEIKDKPILSYILDHLTNYNIKNFIIATGYKHKLLSRYIKKLKYKDCNFKIVNSGINVDIIKRIKDCSKEIKNNILVCYGDTIVDLNIDKLITFYNKNKNKIIFSSYTLKSQYGIIKLGKKGKILSFDEKPDLGLFFNIGYFLLDTKSITKMKKFKKFETFLESKSIRNYLRSFVHYGRHITINTLSELSEAKENLENI